MFHDKTWSNTMEKSVFCVGLEHLVLDHLHLNSSNSFGCYTDFKDLQLKVFLLGYFLGVYSIFTPKINEFCVVFWCLFPFYIQNEWVLCCILVFIPFCVVFWCLFPFYIQNEWVLCCILVFIPFLHPKWMSFVLYLGVHSLFTPKMNEFCVVFRCSFPFYTQNEWVLCCMQVFIPFLHPKWMSFVLYSGIPPVITGDFVFTNW